MSQTLYAVEKRWRSRLRGGGVHLTSLSADWIVEDFVTVGEIRRMNRGENADLYRNMPTVLHCPGLYVLYERAPENLTYCIVNQSTVSIWWEPFFLYFFFLSEWDPFICFCHRTNLVDLVLCSNRCSTEGITGFQTLSIYKFLLLCWSACRKRKSTDSNKILREQVASKIYIYVLPCFH